jgi:hypothetical protein
VSVLMPTLHVGTFPYVTGLVRWGVVLPLLANTVTRPELRCWPPRIVEVTSWAVLLLALSSAKWF